MIAIDWKFQQRLIERLCMSESALKVLDILFIEHNTPPFHNLKTALAVLESQDRENIISQKELYDVAVTRELFKLILFVARTTRTTCIRSQESTSKKAHVLLSEAKGIVKENLGKLPQTGRTVPNHQDYDTHFEFAWKELVIAMRGYR